MKIHQCSCKTLQIIKVSETVNKQSVQIAVKTVGKLKAVVAMKNISLFNSVKHLSFTEACLPSTTRSSGNAAAVYPQAIKCHHTSLTYRKAALQSLAVAKEMAVV